MAPGIPNEKSRTVRPVHGPATIHLPLQVYALPFREASVLIKEGFFIRIHVHTGHKEIFGVYWHMASLGKKS
jgi:hypothetical protein